MSLREHRHLTEYALLRGLELAAAALPRPVALSMGSALGGLLQCSGAYVGVVRANMRHTGIWADAEVARLIPRLYRMIGVYVADILSSTGRVPPHRFSGDDALKHCLSRGKGTIAVLSHLGNWEILANVFGKRIPDLHVVAMPMSNPAVERWLHARRSATGVTTIYKEHAVRRMLEVLGRNGMVAILIDQHAGKHGTMVPFLGRAASTVRTVAGLLRKTDCSIITGAAILQHDRTYDIPYQLGEELGIDRDNEEEFIAAYLRSHNDMLSAMIRQYPEHYFGWFHKRYRGTVDYKRRRREP